jgi:phosphoribosyl 1,2-cyclic phosphate phosphodiesterase
MKIFFLGTGAAEGLPAIFCDCPVCLAARQQGGKDRRTRCSVLVDNVIKIDLPPDTLAHVHAYPQIDLAKLQHLLFTHSHDDHFAVRELQYLSPNFAPCRKGPLNVWATAELIHKMMPEMDHFYERAPLRFYSVLPFDPVPVAHLEVTPITAHHKQDELCLNYLLKDTRNTGKTVLYACDTGWYDPPTWDYLTTQQVDCVIIECGKGNSRNTYEGHLNINEVIRVRTRLIEDGVIKTDTPFYLTHIAHTGLLLHEEMESLVAPHNMQVAYDGLEIEV